MLVTISLFSVLLIASILSIEVYAQQTNNRSNNASLSFRVDGSMASNIKIDYSPVPEKARGPTIPQKGYVVEPLGDGLYFLSNGAYNTMFMVTDEGVIAIDAPPAIGNKYLQAISEVTDKPVKYFIYSHTHKDHVGSANIFPDNTIYIAQKETANQLRVANDSGRPLPTITFSEKYAIKVNNETVLELDYPGVTHEPGNIFIYAPKQKALMFVDVIYPGWVPFDGLGGSENVTGFMDATNMIIKNYHIDKFIGGHLTRIGTIDDIKTQQEFLSDLKAIGQQSLKNISFSDIAKIVGPSNPGNPWAVTNSYQDAMTNQCKEQMTNKWKDRLGGIDIFLDDNCAAMLRSLRLD